MSTGCSRWVISMNALVRLATQHQINNYIDMKRQAQGYIYMCHIIILWNCSLQLWQPRFCGGIVQRFRRGRHWTCWPSPRRYTNCSQTWYMWTSVGLSLNHATHKIVEFRPGELGGPDFVDQWQGTLSASQFCATLALWEGTESCWNTTTCTQGFNVSSSILKTSTSCSDLMTSTSSTIYVIK